MTDHDDPWTFVVMLVCMALVALGLARVAAEHSGPFLAWLDATCRQVAGAIVRD